MLLYLLIVFVFSGLVQGQTRQTPTEECNAQSFTKISDDEETFCIGLKVRHMPKISKQKEQPRQNCPHVSSLICSCDQNDTKKCNAQSFVKLPGDHNTLCIGCKVRRLPEIENGTCPPVACPMFQQKPGCHLLEQFVLVGLDMCPSCQVFHCPTDMPTINLKK